MYKIHKAVSKQQTPTLYWESTTQPKQALSVVGGKRGQQEQTLANPQRGLHHKGGSASSPSPTPTATPAGLCFRWLLAPQKPCGVVGALTDYTRTGNSNVYISKTFRRKRMLLS